jgi:dethiobiotin synthetase
MTAVFVTATGTDIGKTYVTAGMIRQLLGAGRDVTVLKPLSTGFHPAEAEGSDAGVLLKALGKPVSIEEIERINPWRYAAPLSPDIATRRENRAVPVNDVIAFCQRAIAGNKGTLLIEGVGGIMVPLDERRTTLDWIASLGIPLIVVAGSYLGTLSHTLTCLDVLARRGLTVKGLVVNETPGSAVTLADTTATLSHFVKPIPMVAVKRNPEPSAFKAITDLL